VEQFYLPENCPGYEERTYSFDYGNSHFIIQWYYPNGWIEADLENASLKSDFIFLSQHYPSNEGYEFPGYELHDNYSIDIFFTGHMHMIRRSFPLTSNPFNIGGTVYTPEKHYYNNKINGTIHHWIRSATHGKSKMRYFPTLQLVEPGGTLDNGYTEAVFNGKKLVVESFNYTINYSVGGVGTIRSSRNLEDYYIIDKTNNSELPIPQISNINIKEIGSHRAVIEWDTNILSKTQVEFGTSSGNYTYVNMRKDQNNVFNTSHKAVLQVLAPETTYYFRVKSWRAGKENVSEEYSFTTSSVSEGNLVAEFDFGGVAFPSDKTRVSSGGFDFKTRNGWITATKPLPSQTLNLPVGEKDTSCLVHNTWSQGIWRTELLNGEYEIEITSGNFRYSGDVCIYVEDNQATLEKESIPGNTYDKDEYLWTWSAPVNVTDGFLDIKVGCGSIEYGGYTLINSLKIWTKGHFPLGYETDVTPPAQINDLKVIDFSNNSVTLEWTAPGDDKNTGQAVSYDIRYDVGVLADYWYQRPSTQVQNPPAPQPAGTKQNFTITNLPDFYNYYFGIKAIDEIGNLAPLSNTVKAQSPYPQKVPIKTLQVFLNASPDSGVSPLNNVILSAQVSGTAQGNISYYFFCDQPVGILGTGYEDIKYENIRETTKTAVCNYSNTRPTLKTFYGKVIVIRDGLYAENRAEVVVSPAQQTQTLGSDSQIASLSPWTKLVNWFKNFLSMIFDDEDKISGNSFKVGNKTKEEIQLKRF
jgi:hypothetical protein